MYSSRSPLSITLGVWYALFLREALTRVSRQRVAWVWVLLEPVAHIIFLVIMMMTIRMRVIGGIDTPLWLMVGLLSFFVFRRPAQQAVNALVPRIASALESLYADVAARRSTK